MKRTILALCAATLVTSPALAGQVDADDYRPAGTYYGRTDGLYLDTTDKTPVLENNGAASIVPGSPTYSVTFDRGTGDLGAFWTQDDGTAFDSTATSWNILQYGGGFECAVMNVVDGGTNVPATTAAGIDMVVDAANDDDHVEFFAGTKSTSGRPFVVGKDPAFQFCASFTIAALTDTDLITVGFRNPVWDTVTPGSYTEYAGLGIGTGGDGSVFVQDITTGITDTTDGVLAATSAEYCTLVSATGVVTYTLDGAAPTATDAHTITSGDLLIPFVSIRANSATPGGIVMTKWVTSFTE